MAIGEDPLRLVVGDKAAKQLVFEDRHDPYSTPITVSPPRTSAAIPAD